MRQAELREIGQGAAAEIDGEGNVVVVAKLRKLRLGNFRGEALDHVIAGMDLHDHAGIGPDGAGEILQVGAVGGADLDQRAAGLRHDIGHPERAADFDQLAARRRNLLAQCEGIEHQHHGGGVVVDDGRRLRTGHGAKLILDMFVAVAALALTDAVFEVARPPRRVGHRRNRFFRQGGAAEIGVQHRAGQVEHRLQGRGRLPGEAVGDGGQDDLRLRRRAPGRGQFPAQIGQHVADRAGGFRPAEFGDDGLCRFRAQQPVDRRQPRQRGSRGRRRFICHVGRTILRAAR